MLLVTVRDDLAEINRALDEVESMRDQERRRQRLEQALIASRRALEEFLRNDDLAETLRQAQEAISPYADAASAVMMDAMLFGAFIQAERRLFIDLGLDASAADRLTAVVREIGSSSKRAALPVDGLRERLENLDANVAFVLELVRTEVNVGTESAERAEQARAEGHGVLRRVFLVVGGAFVVGTNALVGAGATPITGGLSIVGGAASAAIGGGMISSGFSG